ncbi:MAG TPA: CPBP family glutamic-type intramembrane protease [Gillisia sp.]|nr:CPBP family glutamic-type intramembrane protease [Gillisia sp.]
MLKHKIINLLRNYGWMLACYFLFFIAIGLLQVLFPHYNFTEYQQNDINRMLLENPLQFFLLAVIIAPVLEEGMFRTLIKPSTNELIFFFSCWLVVLITSFIPVDVYWAVKFGFLLVFLIFSFVVLRELIPLPWQWKLCSWLKKYHLLIWAITSVLFGMIHIYNYVEGFELNFVLFLLIFPRIIAGVFFGKVKIENRSLLWPIALHAINNGAVLLLLLPQAL